MHYYPQLRIANQQSSEQFQGARRIVVSASFVRLMAMNQEMIFQTAIPVSKIGQYIFGSPFGIGGDELTVCVFCRCDACTVS